MAHIRPRTLPPLIPPFRHILVERGLYRGAHPSLKNMRFMRRLRLRTIISLIPEPDGPSRDLVEYCEQERIRLMWHQLDKYNDGFAHTPPLVAAVLAVLIDPRNHPLFIHCRDGSHNTGLVIMCLRRLQNWSLPAAYDEFVRYTKSNQITFLEKQFVEFFRAPVTVPPDIPEWLWQGDRFRKHPTIPLRFEDDPSVVPDPSPLRHAISDVAYTCPSSEGNDDHVHADTPSHALLRINYSPKLAALDLCGLTFSPVDNKQSGGSPPIRPWL